MIIIKLLKIIKKMKKKIKIIIIINLWMKINGYQKEEF